jgi:hypothetical protein
MSQRLVVWSIPLFDKRFRNDLEANGLVVDLDLSPTSLASTYPDLNDALAGGRIVSHNYCVAGSARIFSFVVEG